MRTASFGGSRPSFRKRRMLLYDARSTSIENVDSGFACTDRNAFSSIAAYDSVFQGSRGTRYGGAGMAPRRTAIGVALVAAADASNASAYWRARAALRSIGSATISSSAI